MGRIEHDEDRLLRVLVEAVEAETGESFYRSLVRSLAEALEVQYAFVSELTHGGSHFRTLALWERGDFAPNVEVPLDGTPCEAVLRGQIAFHPDHLQERFPRDLVLVDWKAVSYGGVPMLDSSGVVVGHLAFVHDEPLADETRALSVMRIFAKRAVTEIERQRALDAVRASEQRVARILEGASDAILSFDAEGLIRFFNPAAERVLRCRAADAIGTSVSRFSSEQGLALQQLVLEGLEQDPSQPFFIGEDEGVLARRADGTLFLHEASLSRSELDGRVLYTVIFRDVEERRSSAREVAQLRSQTDYLREELQSLHNPDEIVGRSPTLRRVLQDVQRVASADSTVLVCGETGTGKELVARAIHARSRRASRLLVKLNCAALPAGLVESELFGHEKGAFTGATRRRVGRFELADGGTLFLDEVGELPLDVQVKLLRALQEREFERVGGSETLEVDVRVIAATNRDLDRATAEGRFRQDLLYRLNVFPLRIPPLRERVEDIPLLAHYFIGRHAPRVGRRVSRVSAAGLERLAAYAWPGNVRELENVIERALILSSGPELEIPPEVLPVRDAELVAPNLEPPSGPDLPGRAPGPASLDAVERRHILATLRATRGRIEGPAGAAHLLGIRPSTLRSRMQKLGIQRTDLDDS